MDCLADDSGELSVTFYFVIAKNVVFSCIFDDFFFFSSAKL